MSRPVRTEQPFVFAVSKAFGDFREGDRLIVDTEADSQYALWRRVPDGAKSALEIKKAWKAARLKLECGTPERTVESALDQLSQNEAEEAGTPLLRLVR